MTNIYQGHCEKLQCVFKAVRVEIHYGSENYPFQQGSVAKILFWFGQIYTPNNQSTFSNFYVINHPHESITNSLSIHEISNLFFCRCGSCGFR